MGASDRMQITMQSTGLARTRVVAPRASALQARPVARVPRAQRSALRAQPQVRQCRSLKIFHSFSVLGYLHLFMSRQIMRPDKQRPQRSAQLLHLFRVTAHTEGYLMCEKCH